MKQEVFENITIESAGAQGKSIAHIDNKVVFVTGAIPGDIADIKIVKKRRRYLEAVPVTFHHYSDKRAEPFCKHFGICGGCKWQNMDYRWQLHYKQQEVKDSLERIAKVQLPEIANILPSEKTQHYRNKLEFTFSDKRWLTEPEIKSGDDFDDRNALGFHIPGRFDKILQIDECFLQDDKSNEIRNFIHCYAQEKGYTYFDLINQSGLLRNLILRNTATGKWMIIIVFFENDKKAREDLLNAVYDKFQPHSLQYVINQKKNDSIADQEVVLYKGTAFLTEKMEDLSFRIGPKSFYQTNSAQAYNLYKIVRDFAELSGNEIVYDLYTGTGTIANFIAKKTQKVLGIEYIAEAVADAFENAKLNGISNVDFLSGDMKDILTEDLFAKYGYPDVIITDPPRNGMHPEVVEKLLQCNAQKIVYVSCNPATQARDIQLLDKKYKVTKVQPVDMFPHTYHVENVILLEKR